MTEQLKAGPMTVEKQTVSEIRSRGAPTTGLADYLTHQLINQIKESLINESDNKQWKSTSHQKGNYISHRDVAAIAPSFALNQ